MDRIFFSFIASNAEKNKLIYSNKNFEDFFLEHQANSKSSLISECDKDGNERYKWDFFITNTNENKRALLYITECMAKEITFSITPSIVIDDCPDINDKEYINYIISNHNNLVNKFGVNKHWVNEHWRCRNGKYELVSGHWRNRY